MGLDGLTGSASLSLRQALRPYLATLPSVPFAKLQGEVAFLEQNSGFIEALAQVVPHGGAVGRFSTPLSITAQNMLRCENIGIHINDLAPKGINFGEG